MSTKKKTSLPYANSTADPTKAQGRIRETLLKFEVDRIGFEEDLKSFEVMVRFAHRGCNVSLPVNYGRLADRYIEDDPWTTRKRYTKKEWDAKKREIAYKASYSILEDYLKGMLAMVELGAMPFEEVFLSHFINNQGRRLGEVVTPMLPDFTSGKLALGE